MSQKDDQFYEMRGALRPDLLEQLVNDIPDSSGIDIADYASVITKLHDAKDFSFTEIVEFLGKHGIVTNRSAIYRVYKEACAANGPDEPLIDDEGREVVEP